MRILHMAHLGNGISLWKRDDNCVIGGGSIVVKSIPSNSIAVGNPCKVIKKTIVTK